MSKKRKRKAAQEAYSKLLAELDGALYLLVHADGSKEGEETFATLLLLARCLHAAVWGGHIDGEGKHWPHLPAYAGDDLPAQTWRVERAIKDTQEAGVTYALAYHIEGDPLWRFAWSGQFDRGRAIREMIAFLTHGMMFPEVEEDSPTDSST